MLRARAATIFLITLVASACAHHGARVVPPLDQEGELYLYLEPFPQEADRLSFALASIAAVGRDGTEFPLELRLPALSRAEVNRQRLLAYGRLPPGEYRGFVARAQSAALRTAEGTAEMLPSPAPTPLGASFTVRRRTATVWSLSLKYADAIRDGFSFVPAFSAVIAPRTPQQLAGFCSSEGANDVFIFDVHAKSITAAIPTDGGPRGVALDRPGKRLYVAMSREDRVDVFDFESREPLPPIRLSLGDHPGALALTGRTLLVANPGSNTLSFIDLDASMEVARISTGNDPVAVIVDRAGRRAYVMNRRSSTFTVVDVATRTAVVTVTTDAEPLFADLNNAGDRLYVVHRGSLFMTAFSVPQYAPAARVFVGLGMATVRVDPATDLVYVGMENEARLQVFDPFALIPVDTVDLPGAASWIEVDTVERTLWALVRANTEVAAVDLTSRRVVSAVDVGAEPYQILLSPARR